MSVRERGRQAESQRALSQQQLPPAANQRSPRPSYVQYVRIGWRETKSPYRCKIYPEMLCTIMSQTSSKVRDTNTSHSRAQKTGRTASSSAAEWARASASAWASAFVAPWPPRPPHWHASSGRSDSAIAAAVAAGTASAAAVEVAVEEASFDRRCPRPRCCRPLGFRVRISMRGALAFSVRAGSSLRIWPTIQTTRMNRAAKNAGKSERLHFVQCKLAAPPLAAGNATSANGCPQLDRTAVAAACRIARGDLETASCTHVGPRSQCRGQRVARKPFHRARPFPCRLYWLVPFCSNHPPTHAACSLSRLRRAAPRACATRSVLLCVTAFWRLARSSLLVCDTALVSLSVLVDGKVRPPAPFAAASRRLTGCSLALPGKRRLSVVVYVLEDLRRQVADGILRFSSENVRHGRLRFAESWILFPWVCCQTCRIGIPRTLPLRLGTQAPG
jgi:hypothetical protein